MDDYLVHYGELQEVCEVAIGAWEQFGPGYDAVLFVTTFCSLMREFSPLGLREDTWPRGRTVRPCGGEQCHSRIIFWCPSQVQRFF